MSKSIKETTFWSGLLIAGLYKRNQGRLVRQLTAVGLLLVVAYGAWSLSQGPLSGGSKLVSTGVPLLIALVGAWVVYRAVNYPRFADFLISVEAEMDKVSWPSRQELYRAAIVVISVMVFMGAILLLYDIFWQWLFRLIGFLHIAAS